MQVDEGREGKWLLLEGRVEEQVVPEGREGTLEREQGREGSAAAEAAAAALRVTEQEKEERWLPLSGGRSSLSGGLGCLPAGAATVAISDRVAVGEGGAGE